MYSIYTLESNPLISKLCLIQRTKTIFAIRCLIYVLLFINAFKIPATHSTYWQKKIGFCNFTTITPYIQSPISLLFLINCTDSYLYHHTMHLSMNCAYDLCIFSLFYKRFKVYAEYYTFLFPFYKDLLAIQKTALWILSIWRNRSLILV